MFKSMTEVRRANAAAGYYWFSRDTMRFFGTVIKSSLYTGADGRQWFIDYSGKAPAGSPHYGVRQVEPDGSIKTHGHYRTLAEATRVVVGLKAQVAA